MFKWDTKLGACQFSHLYSPVEIHSYPVYFGLELVTVFLRVLEIETITSETRSHYTENQECLRQRRPNHRSSLVEL